MINASEDERPVHLESILVQQMNETRYSPHFVKLIDVYILNGKIYRYTKVTNK